MPASSALTRAARLSRRALTVALVAAVEVWRPETLSAIAAMAALSAVLPTAAPRPEAAGPAIS
ncbi:MAG: hypothetical protein R3F65_32505, partial [bacterium]